MSISNEPLKIDEAMAIADICDRWPGGLGCVLVKAENSKRGYVNGGWGWKGHIPGDFDYAKLQSFRSETTIFCPVTLLGISRGAKDFKDHQIAYNVILTAVIYITGLDVPSAKKFYNDKLKQDQHTLASLFRNFALLLKHKDNQQLKNNAQQLKELIIATHTIAS